MRHPKSNSKDGTGVYFVPNKREIHCVSSPGQELYANVQIQFHRKDGFIVAHTAFTAIMVEERVIRYKRKI